MLGRRVLGNILGTKPKKDIKSKNSQKACIKCGEPVWKGDTYKRNYWGQYCEDHEKEFEENLKEEYKKRGL